jgi:hypothetical protein
VLLRKFGDTGGCVMDREGVSCDLAFGSCKYIFMFNTRLTKFETQVAIPSSRQVWFQLYGL